MGVCFADVCEECVAEVLGTETVLERSRAGAAWVCSAALMSEDATKPDAMKDK